MHLLDNEISFKGIQSMQNLITIALIIYLTSDSASVSICCATMLMFKPCYLFNKASIHLYFTEAVDVYAVADRESNNKLLPLLK